MEEARKVWQQLEAETLNKNPVDLKPFGRSLENKLPTAPDSVYSALTQDF